MNPKHFLLIVAAAILLIVLVPRVLSALAVRALVGPTLTPEQAYPKSPRMPPIVAESMDSLLQRLDTQMNKSLPSLSGFLQPGLSDEQIAQLEREHGVTLSADMKALYKWHNGCRTPAPDEKAPTTLGPIPSKHFLPLDVSLQQIVALREQVKKLNALQKSGYEAAAYREHWLTLFDDGAGDGYFYDPKRKDEEGAVFFHFMEVGEYVFFPSIKNLLAGTLACYEKGVIKSVTVNGVPDLDEDYEKSQAIWKQFGTAIAFGVPEEN